MSDNIRVAIRLRPLIPRELDSGAKILWEAKDTKSIRQIEPPVPYNFDRVFDCNEGNATVYRELCAPIIHSVMDGFHGTIFAYGQTSSGKTHTMLGENGIIPTAIDDIFNAIEFMAEREFLLRVSYLEIYQEKVYDLLASETKSLKIQEDMDGVISVVNLTEEEIKTSQDIFKILQIGETKRRVAETQMNEHSSRSHAIFRVIVESRLRDTEDGAVNVAQLNLVDLAGSERTGQMGEKERKFREGTGINKSLSHLSLVIRQLSQGDRKHVSYRNSCLTRILQNSLGGNAHTLIICTVTPAQLEPTQSTLTFASQAKTIKNKPTANVVWTDQALLKRYANKIKMLSEKLVTMQQSAKDEKKEILEKELQEKEKQNEFLKQQIEQLKEKFIVSQSSEPSVNNFMKKVRRETVCFGALGHKSRLRNHQENTISFFNPLPSVQEEPSFSPNSINDKLDLVQKGRKSSTDSLSLTQSPVSEKVFVNSSVQTEEDAFKRLAGKLKTLVRQLGYKSLHNMKLQKELKELREFTMHEKEVAQAMDEPQESLDIKELHRRCQDLEIQLRKAEEENLELSKIKEMGKQNFCSDVSPSCLVETTKLIKDSIEEVSVFGSVSSCRTSISENCIESPITQEESDLIDFGDKPVFSLLEKEIDELNALMQENFTFVDTILLKSEEIPCDNIDEENTVDSLSLEKCSALCEHKKSELEHAIQVNKIRLSSLEEEVNSLRARCKETEADLNQATICIEDLGNRILKREDEYRDVCARFNKTCGSYSVAVQCAETFKKKAEQAFKLLSVQQQKLDSFNEITKKYELKVSKLQEDVALISGYDMAQIDLLKSDKKEYEELVNTMKSRKEALENENEELKARISSLNDEHRSKLSELAAEMTAQLQSSSEEIRKLHEEQVAAIEANYENKYNGELLALESKHKQEIDAIVRDQVIEKLKIEESAARLSDDYESEILKVISSLKEALDKKCKECESLQLKLQQMNDAISRDSKKKALEKDLQNQVRIQQDTISNLTTQCSELTQKLERCELQSQLQLDNLKFEIRMLKEQEKSKVCEMKSAMEKLDTLLAEERKKLEITEQRYRSTREKLEEHKKEFEERIKYLREQYKNSSKEEVHEMLKESSVKITLLSGCIKEKEEALCREVSKVTELERSLADSETKYSQLRTDYHSSLQKIEELEKNIKLLKVEVDGKENLSRSPKKKDQIIKSKGSQTTSISAETFELRQRVKKLEENNVFLENKLSVTKNELRRMQDLFDESKVEPKQASTNPVNRDILVAGSGAVNAYCIEAITRSKDRRIRKLEMELEKHKKLLSQSKRDSLERMRTKPVPFNENKDIQENSKEAKMMPRPKFYSKEGAKVDYLQPPRIETDDRSSKNRGEFSECKQQ